MSTKETALQIINFLKSSVEKKEVNEDYVDSIDVAIDCIADAFEVNKEEDSATVKTSFRGKSLQEILSEFKDQEPAGEAQVPVHVEHDEEVVKKADELKLEGNKAMARKDFQGAVDKYTEALELTPKNVIYLSNRAAAYSSLRDHEKAIEDANAAIAIDPSYSKAYSRLGLAYYALGKPKDALEAYKKGMESEGDKPTESMKKGYETAKKKVEESLNVAAPEQPSTTDRSTPSASASANSSTGAGAGGLPDLGGLASMLGGAGGLEGILNSPIAQQMMQDPNLMSNLMNNPALSQMAQNFGAGNGQMPDLNSLMNNPMLRNLANQFMQGGAGAGAGTGSGSSEGSGANNSGN
ncbi:SGT2 [Cyberlindnera jadinii]|uniref:SGT2 protein n=2 Tax=Cyberlindnera jadinii (strain ATCC 18201 / CBS 1600 / BCRC 20928 / JCM 3617 / NBRC 0987 / NRRL Y-1542) TaxID=983966 RepID=A0A0H5C7Z3_CYBJN|nr:SGT2 [Cyberlindnera jadinii]